ncbi:hypothetical protein CPLU01_15598 [Colletotrichum plurivorum]|uniref:Uncharacterized protein n=1 Tax=Colletotrichum plurivorum TaxID=2175906 RepID=A0A8H6MUQ8_9PEZI|nr:hypothetical protein CPLU01_15598 [Colletotrichum plurivorum]
MSGKFHLRYRRALLRCRDLLDRDVCLRSCDGAYVHVCERHRARRDSISTASTASAPARRHCSSLGDQHPVTKIEENAVIIEVNAVVKIEQNEPDF